LVSTLANRKRKIRRRLEPDARREEILKAAERLLRRSAASEVRVEDIVREAGAAKGTFYLYFPSFEALLSALRERVFAEFDARYPLPADPGRVTDWLELVDALATGFVDYTLGLGGLHRALFHGSVAPSPSLRASARIVRLIEFGIAARAFAKLDPEPTARLVFAMLHEAVDTIEAGEDRALVLCALRTLLRRSLLVQRPGQ
jgi:AcrR family transcriptional regulator